MSVSNLLVPNNYNILQNSLSYFVQSVPVSFNFTGPFAMTASYTYVRVGDVVTMVLTGQLNTATAATTFVSTGMLPAIIKPVHAQDIIIFGENNGATASLDMHIGSDGTLTVSVLAGPNFTNSALCGWGQVGFTYSLA